MDEISENIARNLAEIRANIDLAAQRSGRLGSDVTLCVVSKTFPADVVQAAYDQGCRMFGENRVQEMHEKSAVLPSDVAWHVIGHLQTNKVRKAVAVASMIQSVDSLALAVQIDRIAGETGRKLEVLLQVNIARDEAKFGFLQEALWPDMEALLALKNITIQGLMTIPELAETAEDARQHFAALRELRLLLEQRLGLRLPHLSMGMSGDYEAAIEEGATIIRVGSRVFGRRT